jgi:hypothetical protein
LLGQKRLAAERMTQNGETARLDTTLRGDNPTFAESRGKLPL